MYWNNDDIKSGIIGGILISIASTINLLMHGRVTGYSGSLKAVSNPKQAKQHQVALVLGTLLIANIIFLYDSKMFSTPKRFLTNLSIEGYLLSGFLVGLGTSLANGCTSGHGVCGIPLISRRSITSVLIFMGVAMGVATLRSYYPFLEQSLVPNISSKSFSFNRLVIIIGLVANAVANLIAVIVLFKKYGIKDVLDYLISLSVGIIFGLGLVISGMTRIEKVLGFLSIDNRWDPTLLFVLGTTVILNFITIQLILSKMKRPILMDNFDLPQRTIIDWKLLLGSVLFGAGWGLSGLCPGPSIQNSLVYLPHSGVFLATLLFGQFVERLVNKTT